MSDRDKPIYNPESNGDINDYWHSSKSFAESQERRKVEMGPVTNKDEWLLVLSKAIETNDDYKFERLREITNDWQGNARERDSMSKILDNLGDLYTFW